ncbi:MAG TPA: GNAT family N-acetyltransferase [Bacteroidota bacterium]|nr:GNAT family N-acetyltransferase [Bacteroidota bacterium]
MVDIIRASTPEEYETAGKLFFEYANSINVSICFENLDKEVADLPGAYAEPSGRLLLAYSDNQLAGCCALKRVDDRACEMKRLFVRSEFRGKGIGKRLARALAEEAKKIGYADIRLDTLPSMTEAIALYRSIGFVPTTPFRQIPVEQALFMQASLDKILELSKKSSVSTH